jgi:hypothetical protein
MPFGRSDAGLKCLSVCRASVVQRMPTLPCAQHVVSTIICRYSRCSGVGGDFGEKQGECFAGQALQPAHEPTRHIGIPPAQQWWCRRQAGFSPSYGELGYRNAGATSLSSVAPGNQVLLWYAGAVALRHELAYALDLVVAVQYAETEPGSGAIQEWPHAREARLAGFIRRYRRRCRQGLLPRAA